jgi:NADH-quinone oxidoreductase subunit M
MILPWLVIWLVAGGCLAGFAGLRSSRWPRWISVITLGSQVLVLLWVWIQYLGQFGLSTQGPWLVEFSRPWIPQLGISLHLAMDGLSLLLVLLTDFLALMAVAASWSGIQERVGFFHFNLLWISAALVGVFLAIDLFLFYFFWEMMLVPLYFLIGIWGHENRVYATIKFFIFTQISGLLMLLAILGLYFLHGRSTGVYTFNYLELLNTSMTPVAALGLMLGFFAAFAVKLPVVPVHTWLPDAHTEAPTAGSVILAGLVLKAGAYGMLRFMIPLFPGAAFSFAPWAMVLAVIGIIYGAVLAFAQTDLKRLVAYTSISHMGFVLLGIFAWNQLALQGAVIIILAHAMSTGALFILVGALQDRIQTRDLDRMGGLWSTLPRMGGVGLVLALASLGLPGLVNFVGEFLVLLGALQVNMVMTALATIGFVVSTVYAVWMMQRTFYGKPREPWKVPDLGAREMAIMAVMIAVIILLGLYPQPVLNATAHAMETLQSYTSASNAAATVARGSDPIWHPLDNAVTMGSGTADGGRP